MLKPIIIQQPHIEEQKLAKFILDLAQASIALSPVIARLLLLRGLDTVEKVQEFLSPDLSESPDPYLMKGMKKTVELIAAHVKQQSLITVYGDYDVDGITSTTILYTTLKKIQAKVSYYIPDRIEEGYGINTEAVNRLICTGTKLIISVDTGITAIEPVRIAKEQGIDMVITDHHECQDELPLADAILNPKQADCDYPFKFLAGVGVTYKLVQALAIQFNLEDEFILDLLEIVAVGTVADLVPLIGENRTMVYHAFLRMENMKNIGLRALFDVAGVDIQKRSSGVIGFQIGPRLNAAGRLGDAKRGVELFLTQNREEAASIAEILNAENQKRRDMEDAILAEADHIIQTTLIQDNPKVLVVAHEGWHHGVIGIVASRITEKYYRPTLILAIEEGVASGSARSVDGFSIFDALMSTKHVFTKVGGHDMAAGMSLPCEHIEELTKNLNRYAAEQMTKETLIPKSTIEYTLPLEDISIDFIEALELMEPYGMGNEEPRFLFEGIVSSMELMGKEKNHFKLKLSSEQLQKPIDAISFYRSSYYEELAQEMPINLIGTLQVNEWKSYKNPQIFIKNISYKPLIESNLVEVKELLSAIQARLHANHDTTIESVVQKFVELKSRINRDDCVSVYKNLKKRSLNENAQMDIPQMITLYPLSQQDLAAFSEASHPSNKNNLLRRAEAFGQRYREIAVILAIFIELELLTITFNKDNKIEYLLSSTKKVELTQSKLYNKMCCQND
jgi:single-stranded-DNA-specific exonuclease